MTDATEQKLKALTDKTGTLPDCPMCSNSKWLPQDEIHFAGIIDIKTKEVNPVKGSPFFNIYCINCGYTASFNINVFGNSESSQ